MGSISTAATCCRALCQSHLRSLQPTRRFAPVAYAIRAVPLTTADTAAAPGSPSPSSRRRRASWVTEGKRACTIAIRPEKAGASVVFQELGGIADEPRRARGMSRARHCASRCPRCQLPFAETSSAAIALSGSLPRAGGLRNRVGGVKRRADAGGLGAGEKLYQRYARFQRARGILARRPPRHRQLRSDPRPARRRPPAAVRSRRKRHSRTPTARWGCRPTSWSATSPTTSAPRRSRGIVAQRWARRPSARASRGC